MLALGGCALACLCWPANRHMSANSRAEQTHSCAKQSPTLCGGAKSGSWAGQTRWRASKAGQINHRPPMGQPSDWPTFAASRARLARRGNVRSIRSNMIYHSNGAGGHPSAGTCFGGRKRRAEGGGRALVCSVCVWPSVDMLSSGCPLRQPASLSHSAPANMMNDEDVGRPARSRAESSSGESIVFSGRRGVAIVAGGGSHVF